MTVTTQATETVRERAYTWSDPLETADVAAKLSGMEFFAALAEGQVPPPPILDTLDFDGISFDEGRVEFRLTPKEFHYNPIGSDRERGTPATARPRPG